MARPLAWEGIPSARRRKFSPKTAPTASVRAAKVAPTTVSLLVGDRSRMGILERRKDEADRRRRITGIAAERHPAIRDRLAPGAASWRKALAPLTPDQRRMSVDTLLAYEAAVSGEEQG
ncbi:hypothetical protein ACFXKG_14375 [Streptomyces sp. NPDC059255]|uniref:hypothetical protein n=1 Tax=Streptomyces sp. NPDC059255 TaxID=3346793 RepID=UPI0036C94782